MKRYTIVVQAVIETEAETDTLLEHAIATHLAAIGRVIAKQVISSPPPERKGTPIPESPKMTV